MWSDSGSRSSDAGSSASPASTAASSVVGRAVAQRRPSTPRIAVELLAGARRAAARCRSSARSESTKRGGTSSALGGALAPRGDLLRDAAPTAAQLARALDAPPRDLGLGPGADALAALLALVGRPLEPAHRLEARDEHVVQREEVLDVGRRVDALLGAAAAGGSSR